MRKLLLVVALLIATVAAAGTGIILLPSTRYETTNCAAGGSAVGTAVPAGTYIFRVTDEDSFLCYSTTCATGGEKFPAGFAMLLTLQAATDLSCRSTNSTGDVILTRGN